jgi:hypothetical protein
MLESILVGLIVAAATGYAAWALTPAVSRNRLAARLAHGLGGPEASGLRGRVATWLQRLPCQYADAGRTGTTERTGKIAFGNRCLAPAAVSLQLR